MGPKKWFTQGDKIEDTACNLECVSNIPQVHEFIGPVKIVLMDVPPAVYKRKAWMSALIAFAELLIGATVFIVLYYSITLSTDYFMKVHVLLCTIGLQLFMPAGILMHRTLHGPSMNLKHSDRIFQHIVLQGFTTLFAVVGAVAVILFSSVKIKYTLHCWIGVLAVLLTILATVFGPLAYKFQNSTLFKGIPVKIFHVAFGLPAFAVSSLCFCSAVIASKTLREWASDEDIVYLLIIFCCIYTFIVLATGMKFANKE